MDPLSVTNAVADVSGQLVAEAHRIEWVDTTLRTASVVLGLMLLWAAIMSAVGVMLVPRPTNQRLATLLARAAEIFFKAMAHRARKYTHLDRILAVQGPTTVLLFLSLFLAVFLAAFGFLFFGITGCSPGEAFFRSGSSMTTLGVVNATGSATLTVMFVAGFMGTTVISVFIGFLMTLYSAYITRETFMSKLALLCGEPGWGPEFVVRAHKLKSNESETSVILAIDWICSMRVSQFIYPILNHFRSAVSRRHWTVTLLAILDSAALRLSIVEREKKMQLIRLLAEGAETFHILRLGEMARTSGNLDGKILSTWEIETDILESDARLDESVEAGLEREDWERAVDFIESHGVETNGNRDAAWKRFCRLRALYFQNAYYLTNTLSAVNAPWSGERHPAVDFPPAWPLLAAKYFGERSGIDL